MDLVHPLVTLGAALPEERIFLIPATAGSPLSYYRKDGAHFVPKLGVEDLLV